MWSGAAEHDAPGEPSVDKSGHGVAAARRDDERAIRQPNHRPRRGYATAWLHQSASPNYGIHSANKFGPNTVVDMRFGNATPEELVVLHAHEWNRSADVGIFQEDLVPDLLDVDQTRIVVVLALK